MSRFTPITLADYVGKFADRIPADHADNAKLLLIRVNTLLERAVGSGKVVLELNPKTGTLISGTQYGGWRPHGCPEGAENSSHKLGMGVDIYDIDGDLDEWLDDASLAMAGLYREHPSQTRHWCHLTTRPPNSGKRTFYA